MDLLFDPLRHEYGGSAPRETRSVVEGDLSVRADLLDVRADGVQALHVPARRSRAQADAGVGIAIPNTELWLVDENDQRVAKGGVGQLVIRGATVMAGYWEKPESTAKKLRPGPVPGERVLYTGDLCKMDEDGYLYFVARMDDVIKSSWREGGAEGGRERARQHFQGSRRPRSSASTTTFSGKR